MPQPSAMAHPPVSRSARGLGILIVVGAVLLSLLSPPADAATDASGSALDDPSGEAEATSVQQPTIGSLDDVPPGEQVEVIVSFDADMPARDAVGPTADRGRELGVAQARAALASRLSDHGIGIDRSYERSAHVVATVAAEQIDDLKAIPGVAAVTLDHRMVPMLDSARALVGANPASAGGTTFSGAGQAVAILDTGVDSSHPFFARVGGGHRVVAEACFAKDIEDCPEGEEGPGAAAPVLVNGSPNSHGTHVAGIAAGSRDGTGPAHGMAPEADLLAVQVFSTDGGLYARWSDILAGLEWVYRQRNDHDIAAVNLSLGGDSFSGSCDWLDPYGILLGAVDDLRSAGIVTVAASGNLSSRGGIAAPACFSNVVAVGASTNDDKVAGFSDISGEVDLVAPGVGIQSSVVGGYARWSGTSMATPMAAGALALLAEAAPTASAGRLVDGVTTSYTTIDDQRSSGFVIGLPRLDLPASLADLGHDTTSTQSAPSVSSTLGSLRINVSWSQPSTANGGTLTYRLHRSEGSTCSSKSALLHEGRGTGYVDKGLTHDRTYRYCAYAIEGTGNFSARSNVRTVTAKDTVAPSATSLSGSGGDRQAKLSWTKVSDPTTPITYRLHRSTGNSCSTSSTRVTTTTKTSFTDTGLDPARSYRYCVTATDAAGNTSSLSNIRRITTTDPLAGCTALSGDWNRSGKDGIGWWCDGKTKLRTSSGKTIAYNYGRAGDVPVIADWNGNGQETVSVIRDGTWHVNNRLSGGASERTFHYGRVTRGDVPIAGDWNRGGVDLPGIVRDREWHLRAEQSGGNSDWNFVYGRLTRGDLPLWGDWNRDRRATVGIVRDGTWHLRNVHAGGASDISFVYGRVLAGDLPIVGDWTGDGVDTPAIVRDGQWHLRYENKGGAADRVITFHAP